MAGRSAHGTTKKTGKAFAATSKSGVSPSKGGKNLQSRARRSSASAQVGRVKGGINRTHAGPGIDGAGGP